MPELPAPAAVDPEAVELVALVPPVDVPPTEGPALDAPRLEAPVAATALEVPLEATDVLPEPLPAVALDDEDRGPVALLVPDADELDAAVTWLGVDPEAAELDDARDDTLPEEPEPAPATVALREVSVAPARPELTLELPVPSAGLGEEKQPRVMPTAMIPMAKARDTRSTSYHRSRGRRSRSPKWME